MKGFSFLRRRRWRCSWWPAAARGRRTRRNIGAPRPGTLVQWANCQPAHPDACPPAPNAGCSRSRWTTPSPMASSPRDCVVAYPCPRVSFSRIFPVARLPGMRCTRPGAFSESDVRQYPVRVAGPPTQAMCKICNSAGPVVKAGPVWSRGKGEPTPWIVDVDCATCGVQCGRADT